MFIQNICFYLFSLLNRFTIYLRFFSLAVIDYIIELIGAADSNENMPSFFFHIIFYSNLVHCVLIFVVTIKRRDVLQALSLR